MQGLTVYTYWNRRAVALVYTLIFLQQQTHMKLNKDQKTFFVFLRFILLLIAIFLSVLIAKKLFFTNDEIMYSRDSTITTFEPYTTKHYTGPTSSGRRIAKKIINIIDYPVIHF